MSVNLFVFLSYSPLALSGDFNLLELNVSQSVSVPFAPPGVVLTSNRIWLTDALCGATVIDQ